MDNPSKRRKLKAPRATRLLAVDAWIDSTLYEAGFKARETWENLTIFFRRFKVTGWRRGVVELASEGFTWGTVGAITLNKTPGVPVDILIGAGAGDRTGKKITAVWLGTQWTEVPAEGDGGGSGLDEFAGAKNL